MSVSAAVRNVRARSVAVLLVLALGSLARVAAANCGAEGCPLAPRGPEASAGRFAFNIGYQYIEQDHYWNGNNGITADSALAAWGGAGHVFEQLTITRSTLFNGSARITGRLLVAATLPYIDRIHRHELEHHAGYFIPYEWHMTGLGDGTVTAFWTGLGGGSAPSGTLTLLAGIKLPTGVTDVAPVNDEVPEASARPGTGSTDFLFGLQYGRQLGMRTLDGLRATMPLSVHVSARYNGLGTDDYRMGNDLAVDVAGGYAVLRWFQLLAQLNGSAHARDEVGNTDAEPHNTGGTALLASPGVNLRLLPGMNLFGYYQFRLYQHTNGPQLVAPYHVSVGLSYGLGH